MKNFSCIFVLNVLSYLMFVRNVLVAQLDRVFGYEPKGRGFESLQAHHVGAKFALLRFSMQKNIRPLPCSSFFAKRHAWLTFATTFLRICPRHKYLYG